MFFLIVEMFVFYFLFLCADDIQVHLFKLQLEGHSIVVEQRNTKLSKEKQLKVLLVHSVSWRGTLANFSNMYLLYCDTIISDRLVIIIISGPSRKWTWNNVLEESQSRLSLLQSLPSKTSKCFFVKTEQNIFWWICEQSGFLGWKKRTQKQFSTSETKKVMWRQF